MTAKRNRPDVRKQDKEWFELHIGRKDGEIHTAKEIAEIYNVNQHRVRFAIRRHLKNLYPEKENISFKRDLIEHYQFPCEMCKNRICEVEGICPTVEKYLWKAVPPKSMGFGAVSYNDGYDYDQECGRHISAKKSAE